MQYVEKSIYRLNPHAAPYEPKKEVDEVNVKEGKQQKDRRIIKLIKGDKFGWKIPSKTIIKRNEHEGTTIALTCDKK